MVKITAALGLLALIPMGLGAPVKKPHYKDQVDSPGEWPACGGLGPNASVSYPIEVARHLELI